MSNLKTVDLKKTDLCSGMKQMKKALEDDGCVVVASIFDRPTVEKLRAELEPHFQQSPNCNGDFYGYITKRLSSLIAKSSICRLAAAHPMILEIMDTILLPACEQYQLNLTQAIKIGPGEFRQPLHRDDAMFPFEKKGLEAMVNCMWAVDDFTKENGATLVVPGSHKWDMNRQPEDHEIVQAVMPAGAVLIWTGSLLHAGGTNCSDATRTGVVISYNLGWLRQAENQYLAVPLEAAKNYSASLKRLMGYFVHSPNLGCIEGQDPIMLLERGDLTNIGFQEFLPQAVKPLLQEHRRQASNQ